MTTLNAITSPAPALVTTVDSTGNLVLQAVNSIQLQSGSNTVTVPTGTGTILTTSNPQSGGIIQVVSTTLNTKFTYTGGGQNSWTSVTGLSATITPKFSTSKILILVNISGGPTGQSYYLASSQVIRGSTPVGVGATTSGYTSVAVGDIRTATDTNGGWIMAYSYLDSPATVSNTTYQVQMLGESGVSYNLNATGGDVSGQGYSTRSQSTITLMEVAQ
jgi:hypothetical protein